MTLSRDIDELEGYKNLLTAECLKLERRKAQLAVDILNDIQEYREAGYEEHIPIKQPVIAGSNISDLIISMVEGIDLAEFGFGGIGNKFKPTLIKALQKNRDKIDEKANAFLAEHGEEVLSNLSAQMGKRQVSNP